MPERIACRFACCLTFLIVVLPVRGAEPPELPRASDDRLQVDLFAASPDIVHPIGIAFDRRGRLLVVESHTHFRPENYQGPKHDRVRILEDTDGDGRADRFTTFYEGTSSTMAIAVHPEGAVYLATRNEILRLRDTKGEGKADVVQQLVFLDTKGNYPHNGLSGLVFDSRGNLYFGLGENLGADYTLKGSDGAVIRGGGEGGNVFWCTADGKGLRRVATGFWNPFGQCRDIYGRQFAVDNDPDEMPPCRMVNVVEGGDYGFQFRYGRSGRHPFQAWDGQLPGTLPMITGVGEAPCQLLDYESDGLPREYLGNLLVASWADHRIERYELKERGASVGAEKKPFVQGGGEFRPVGIVVAPDGSLFVTDWVKPDYTLHGKGAVWHIHAKTPIRPERPEDPKKALLSLHRPLREAAASRLAADAGRGVLRTQLSNPDIRVRAACVTALLDAGGRKFDFEGFIAGEKVTPLRARVVRALVEQGGNGRPYLDNAYPAALRFEAVGSLREKEDVPRLLTLLTDADPFLRHAAVHQLAQVPALLDTIKLESVTNPQQRVGLLLAWRASGRPEAARLIPAFLSGSDEDGRFLAAKWIADQKLEEFRPLLVKGLQDPRLSVRLFFAYSAALARLDGREVTETQMAEYFFARLQDAQAPVTRRVMALQMIPPTFSKLTPQLLSYLAKIGEPELQREAVRALTDSPRPERLPLLKEIALDAKRDDQVRAQAVLGLSGSNQDFTDLFMKLADGEDRVLRDEALRALVQVKLTKEQQSRLEEVAREHADAGPLVARVLGRPFAKDRPPATNLDAWRKHLEGPADVAAGRRVFFHPKLAGCFRCHRAEGRGAKIGPDLSAVGRNDPRQNLESVLQPSALIAPHYQAWQIETRDGKVRTGMLVNTQLDEYTYLDPKGELFKVNTRNVVETRALSTSIMPDGLVELMTDQELRDLFAYLSLLR